MTATYVIDENQILRSMEYQITLIMPEITQDLSGNKMLGKDRKMQITVTAEVDRYNRAGLPIRCSSIRHWCRNIWSKRKSRAER